MSITEQTVFLSDDKLYKTIKVLEDGRVKVKPAGWLFTIPEHQPMVLPLDSADSKRALTITPTSQGWVKGKTVFQIEPHFTKALEEGAREKAPEVQEGVVFKHHQFLFKVIKVFPNGQVKVSYNGNTVGTYCGRFQDQMMKNWVLTWNPEEKVFKSGSKCFHFQSPPLNDIKCYMCLDQPATKCYTPKEAHEIASWCCEECLNSPQVGGVHY